MKTDSPGPGNAGINAKDLTTDKGDIILNTGTLVLGDKGTPVDAAALAVYPAAFIDLCKKALEEVLGNPFKYEILRVNEKTRVPCDHKQVLDIVSGERGAIIQGTGGSGKTSQLYLIAMATAKAGNFIPVWIEAGRFDKDMALDVVEERVKCEAILNSSVRWCVPNCEIGTLRKLGKPLCFFINGLNEIPTDKATTNLDGRLFVSIARYFADNPRDRAIVTTRWAPKAKYSWVVFELGTIERDSVLKKLSAHFGKPADYFDDKLVGILTNPFFLNLFLQRTSPEFHKPTKAEIIKDFFTRAVDQNGMGLQENQLAAVAKRAYEAYAANGGTVFEQSRMEDIPELVGSRMLAGTLRVEGENVSFDHQLKHDFLAAYHLAFDPVARSSRWDHRILDSASWYSENSDPLTMVVELLADRPVSENDAYIRAVYNWHLGRVLDCLLADREATEKADSVFSREVRFAVFALIAAKKADPMFNTFNVYRQNSGRAKGAAFSGLFELDFPAVRQRVLAFKSDQTWFGEWQKLFGEDDAVLKGDARLIMGSDPLMAWTTANALRIRSNTEITGLLCGHLLSDTAAENSIARWRVAFVLGATPDASYAADALLHVLSREEEDVWTRYGAGRSLVELAARSTNPEKRAGLIAKILEKIQQPNFCRTDGRPTRDRERILREIGRSVLFRKVENPEHWRTCVAPLVEYVETQLKDLTLESWKRDERPVFDDGRWMSTGEVMT